MKNKKLIINDISMLYFIPSILIWNQYVISQLHIRFFFLH